MPQERPTGRRSTKRRSIAVVFVHYHGPDLVRRAWEALRDDASSHEIELEGVVVDNGSSAEERRLLVDLEPELVEPGSNLGYAGGANFGIERTRSERILLSNPDVRVLPGCLAALVDALESGATVAGPSFFWDRKGGFRLPPTERRTRRAELLRLLAHRPRWHRRARRAWRCHAREHWLAPRTHTHFDLSGALLAFHREAWRRLPFDEGYPLYYEETDWLRRLRASGEKAVHVPEAAALHSYAQSTRSEPRAEQWFRFSERRFRARHYGRLFTRVLEGLGNRWVSRNDSPITSPETGGEEPLVESSGALPLPRRFPSSIRWLELSPSAAGFPAAGRMLEPGEVPALSEDLWALLAPGTYFLRALDAEDRTVAQWILVRNPS